MQLLFFQLFSLAHLLCASSFPHLHGRTGLPHQTPAQLQSLLCLKTIFTLLNSFQVILKWRTPKESQLNPHSNPPRNSQLLLPFLLLDPLHLQFQLQVPNQTLFPPSYHGISDRFCLYILKELTQLSILIYNDPRIPRNSSLFIHQLRLLTQSIFPPCSRGVSHRFYTYYIRELTLVSTLSYNNLGFLLVSFFINSKNSFFFLESPSTQAEDVDIESIEVQTAVNQASKGLGSSTNSNSSQPISNFFAPATNEDHHSFSFDDLFEETSFNLEQVVVLTHVPKEVDWNALKNHFSVAFGLLDLEFSALDRALDTCYLAFKEISVATSAKNYKGPFGTVDLTHSKQFIQAEFMVDLNANLPYRAVLFGVQPGDTVEALSLKMDAVPVRIKIIEGRNFAIALFDVISEWCKVLAQQYFVVNNHAISIVDAIDATNQAQFYRLFMGWVPRMAKHAHLIRVVERISGHLPLHLAIVKDQNNLSRGFAFLVVKTLQEKEKLLNANEFTLKTCKCKFKEARPLKRAPKN